MNGQRIWRWAFIVLIVGMVATFIALLSREASGSFIASTAISDEEVLVAQSAAFSILTTNGVVKTEAVGDAPFGLMRGFGGENGGFIWLGLKNTARSEWAPLESAHIVITDQNDLEYDRVYSRHTYEGPTEFPRSVNRNRSQRDFFRAITRWFSRALSNKPQPIYENKELLELMPNLVGFGFELYPRADSTFRAHVYRDAETKLGVLEIPIPESARRVHLEFQGLTDRIQIENQGLSARIESTRFDEREFQPEIQDTFSSGYGAGSRYRRDSARMEVEALIVDVEFESERNEFVYWRLYDIDFIDSQGNSAIDWAGLGSWWHNAIQSDDKQLGQLEFAFPGARRDSGVWRFQLKAHRVEGADFLASEQTEPISITFPEQGVLQDASIDLETAALSLHVSAIGGPGIITFETNQAIGSEPFPADKVVRAHDRGAASEIYGSVGRAGQRQFEVNRPFFVVQSSAPFEGSFSPKIQNSAPEKFVTLMVKTENGHIFPLEAHGSLDLDSYIFVLGGYMGHIIRGPTGGGRSELDSMDFPKSAELTLAVHNSAEFVFYIDSGTP